MGYGGGERGSLYTYRYIVKTGMTSALKSTETIRLIRDWEKGGRGYEGGGRGRLYTYRYTVTTLSLIHI